MKAVAGRVVTHGHTLTHAHTHTQTTVTLLCMRRGLKSFQNSLYTSYDLSCSDCSYLAFYLAKQPGRGDLPVKTPSH